MYFKIGHLQMLVPAVVMVVYMQRGSGGDSGPSQLGEVYLSVVPSLPVQLVAPCAGRETIRSVTMVALVIRLQIQIQIHHICNRSPDLIRREN